MYRKSFRSIVKPILLALFVLRSLVGIANIVGKINPENQISTVFFKVPFFLVLYGIELIIYFVLIDMTILLIALLDLYALKVLKRTLLVLFVFSFVVRSVLFFASLKTGTSAWSVLVSLPVNFIMLCGSQLLICIVLVAIAIVMLWCHDMYRYRCVNLPMVTFTIFKQILFDLLVCQMYFDFVVKFVGSSKGNYVLAFFFVLLFALLYVIQLLSDYKEHFTLVAACLVFKVLFTGIDSVLKILMIVQSSTTAHHYDHIDAFVWLMELIEAAVVVVVSRILRAVPHLSTAFRPIDAQPRYNRPINAFNVV